MSDIVRIQNLGGEPNAYFLVDTIPHVSSLAGDLGLIKKLMMGSVVNRFGVYTHPIYFPRHLGFPTPAHRHLRLQKGHRLVIFRDSHEPLEERTVNLLIGSSGGIPLPRRFSVILCPQRWEALVLARCCV